MRRSAASSCKKADYDEASPGWSDAATAGTLAINSSTALRIRREFMADGLNATLARKCVDPVSEQRLVGAKEALLNAVACSIQPEGKAQWIPQLLLGELVRLDAVEGDFP